MDDIDEVELNRMCNSITNVIEHCNLTEKVSEYCQELEKNLSLNKNIKSKVEFKCYKGPEVEFELRIKLFKLLETNMKKLYLESDWGWNVADKNNELFHPSSRLIIVYSSLENDSDKKDILGFISFRFEWDDEEEPEHVVVYCYEVQIQSSYRGLKLGKYLMSLLVDIQKKLSLWKVLLSCFKHNSEALKFYKAIGFEIDYNSPSRHGYNEESYELLSNLPNLR